MDVMEARRRLLKASDVLPPMYKRCDYLQAQGDTAVIDTGVPGNNDLLKFDFCFNVDRYIQYRGFFTNYSSETANVWRLSEYTSSTVLIFGVNTRTNTSGGLNIAYIGKKAKVVMDKSSVEITVDGETKMASTIPTATGTENSGTIYINSSRRYARTNDDVIKWYYFRMWDNGTPIRNYIPCIRCRDNKAGFWDAVNRTFNPSIGTAEFIAGYDS